MDPLRVLIVDDEEELVSALAERLKLRGFDAGGVTTAADALARLDTESWDVVLVDVKMPGMGGLELLRQVKDRHPEVQVVLITGHSSVREAEEGSALGGYEYLIKPVPIDELARVLRAAAREEAP
jgi:two-component system OmpR family response regulator